MVAVIDFTGKCIAFGTTGEIDNLNIDDDPYFQRTDDGVEREFNVLNSYGEIIEQTEDLKVALRELRTNDEANTITTVEIDYAG